MYNVLENAGIELSSIFNFFTVYYCYKDLTIEIFRVLCVENHVDIRYF